jgi:hypothetical protein
VIWQLSSAPLVASAMCNMAEKSPDAPSVPWRCGYGAHDSREAGIDLRECQMTAKIIDP